jgi:acyl-coenzyme A thioesterase PaaI-like protein
VSAAETPVGKMLRCRKKLAHPAEAIKIAVVETDGSRDGMLRPMNEPCLQERYAPHSTCFGCGPANARGLHVRSFVSGDSYIAEWTPELHHEAFPGVLGGGIIGTLLDCHMNWTAAHALMLRAGEEKPQCTVTAEYTVQLQRPTPTDGPVTIRARIVETGRDRATVTSTLEANGKVCATGRGLFVAVKPGHPAYHAW